MTIEMWQISLIGFWTGVIASLTTRWLIEKRENRRWDKAMGSVHLPDGTRLPKGMYFTTQDIEDKK